MMTNTNAVSRHSFLEAVAVLDSGEIIRKAAESFHAARKRAGGPY